MQHHDLITIRMTAYEQHSAYAAVKRAAEYQLSIAKTAKDRRWWQHCVDRADHHLVRWQLQIDKEQIR